MTASPVSSEPASEFVLRKAWVHAYTSLGSDEATAQRMVQAEIDSYLRASVPSATKASEWKPGEARVVCAACRDADGRIVTGARHYDAVMMEQIKRSPNADSWRAGEQGFIDQHGNFLTREQAHKIATAQWQIMRRVGSDDCTLFSENLY